MRLVVAAPSAELGAIVQPMFSVAEGRCYGALLPEAAAEFEPRLDPAVALAPEAAAREALLTHGCWEEAVPGFDDLDAAPVLASPEVADLLAAELDDWGTFDPQDALGPLLVVHGEVDESLPLRSPPRWSTSSVRRAWRSTTAPTPAPATTR